MTNHFMRGYILSASETQTMLNVLNVEPEFFDTGELIEYNEYLIMKHNVIEKYCYEVVGEVGQEFPVGKTRHIDDIKFTDYRDSKTGNSNHQNGVMYKYETNQVVISRV